VHEVGDLIGVQVLQHEVSELGVAQPLRLIAHDPRRHDNGRVGGVAAEALDVVDDRLARPHIEQLVQKRGQEPKKSVPDAFSRISEQLPGLRQKYQPLERTLELGSHSDRER
jgi:hypothetical protein